MIVFTSKYNTWLKSENGVRLARIDRKFVGACSTCVETPTSTSAGVHAMSIYTCSNEPIWSSRLFAKYFTGRIILARVEKRYRPGYCPPRDGGTIPISRSRGTLWRPSVFHIRRFFASCLASDGGAHPITLPSNWTQRFSRPFISHAKDCVMPWDTSSCGMWETVRGDVTMRHVLLKWFSRPQGEPSGVWTGQRNPKTMGQLRPCKCGNLTDPKPRAEVSEQLLSSALRRKRLDELTGSG